MTVPFGKQFRNEYFSVLDSNVTPVNHGSFGLSPNVVLEHLHQVTLNNSRYPDNLFRRELKSCYVEALRLLAPIVKTDYTNLAIVDNATSGLNTFLRSPDIIEHGDTIVISNVIYGAIRNLVNFLAASRGVRVRVVTLDFPKMTPDDVVEAFESELASAIGAGETVKACVFDLISSMPAFKIPYERLVEVCRKKNVLSVIDGAHGVGMVDIDLGRLNPDFFVLNLHKWFYVPAGSAVMYVKPKWHSKIVSLPISWSYTVDVFDSGLNPEPLVDKFYYVGTKSFAMLLCIPVAVAFRKNQCGGEEKIMKYCNELARATGEAISRQWNTEVLDTPNWDYTTSMVTVRLPEDALDDLEPSMEMDHKLGAIEVDQFGTYVPITKWNGHWYARFSCQVYNELSDYQYAASKLLEAISILRRLKSSKL